MYKDGFNQNVYLASKYLSYRPQMNMETTV